jgi:sugar phosphate isomerase/epimerase
MNRRAFLASTALLAAPLRGQQQRQTFKAGIVPGGGGGRGPSPLEAFWTACDECSRLGVRHIEVNNTPRRIVEAYDSRIPEFLEEMNKRNLTMLGFALYSHMHDSSARQELISHHLRVAHFLKAVGGTYIAHLLAPGKNLGNAEDDDHRKMDLKTAVANVNEVCRSVRGETGIRVGYHPEQGDIRTGVFQQYVESADPKYFGFWPDVGHLTACGIDPLTTYQKYRSLMVGTHLRDFAPGEPRGRMVPFGTGVIRLPVLVDYLRETRFDGPVMGEGGGSQAMHRYMSETLKMEF